MEQFLTEEHAKDLEACFQPWLDTANTYLETKVPLSRLLWEGSMVLNQAVASYQARKFDSLPAAVECLMRRRIIDYLASERCEYPVPFEVLDLIKFLRTKQAQYEKEEGHVPTIAEFTDWLKLQSQHEVVKSFQKKRDRMAEDQEIVELTKLVDGLLPDLGKIMRYSSAKP